MLRYCWRITFTAWLLALAALSGAAQQRETAVPAIAPGTAKPAETSASSMRPGVTVTAAAPDYSKESFVIQEFSKTATFAKDGTWELTQRAVVGIQSDAGVKQFGVLAFAYDRGTQAIRVDYVRVRKQDGKVVETPEENIQDVSSDVSRVAPTYSDIRIKEIPVKALAPSDVLEYQIRLTQKKAEVQGQFWYVHNFLSGAVVIKETLETRVPADVYVNVASPKKNPEITTASEQKIYLWKSTQLEPTGNSQAPKKKALGDSTPSVQISTFKTWQEVGAWYRNLEKDRIRVTPGIQAKADELTKGKSTKQEKAQALYSFVATKFRYVSLSLGAGRYQPHPADEVLGNEYGDCKDKHTLFAALLKAEGIQADAALMGDGIKIDPNVPSPGQFNHVITVVEGEHGRQWLDTTPEVAPYGLLQASLRGEQALVIPDDAPAELVKTPENPPFLSSQRMRLKAVLKADGTLTGHFDVTLRGDAELDVRSAFRQVSPAQWVDLVQLLVASQGFGGKVSNVEAGKPENLDGPFQYSYDYNRPNYSDWQNHRITVPLAPILNAPEDDAERPTEPFLLAAPGEISYQATVELPKGYSAGLGSDVKAQGGFGEYNASYTLKDGILTAERRLVIKQAKIPVEDWDGYRKFAKQVADDHNQFVAVNELKATNGKAPGNAEAADLIEKAMSTIRAGDMMAARDYLQQAERLNPQQLDLQTAHAALDLSANRRDEGLAALQKELDLHPENVRAFRFLIATQEALRKRDDEIATLRRFLKLVPGDADATLKLAQALGQEKRYTEIIELRSDVEKIHDPALEQVFSYALLKTGRKDEAVELLKNLAQSKSAPILNDLAFVLADTDTALPLAEEYARAAVNKFEEEASRISLPTPGDHDLRLMPQMAASWDTLGWVYYRMGDLERAQKFVEAAWNLSQRGDVGDHLGQIYMKQGRREQAIHVWQLALAANRLLDETRERLRLAGASSTPPHPTLRRSTTLFVSPDEELGKLRTTDIADLPKQESSAEFFLLFSAGKISAAQFISGSDRLREAGASLKSAHFRMPFPDTNAEKIVRRGILSCSTYTSPSCQLVLLLPDTARSSGEERPAASPAQIAQQK